MSIQHTVACLQAQKAHQQYIAMWPHACKPCKATGVVTYPGVWRRPDGSGEPDTTDLCSDCLGNEAIPFSEGTAAVLLQCPRCGEHKVYVQDVETFDVDDLYCIGCGWAGNNTNTHMPDFECECGRDGLPTSHTEPQRRTITVTFDLVTYPPDGDYPYTITTIDSVTCDGGPIQLAPESDPLTWVLHSWGETEQDSGDIELILHQW